MRAASSRCSGLFATQIESEAGPNFDDAGRVRVDDWEMRPEVQADVKAIWPGVTTETLGQRVGYRHRRISQRVFELVWVRLGRRELRGGDRTARDHVREVCWRLPLRSILDEVDHSDVVIQSKPHPMDLVAKPRAFGAGP